MDVANWLRDLGLQRYEASFRENDVRAEDLCHLTAEDLDGRGVVAVGHRRRLLVAIAKLNEQAGTEAVTRGLLRRPALQHRSAKMRCRTPANAASLP